MSSIEKLLVRLSEDTENYRNKDNEKNYQINKIMEVKNILTYNKLDISSLTYKDIINLRDNDLKALIRCTFPDNEYNHNLSTIKVSINIIKMYEKLSIKFGNIANATQQETSINAINAFLIQIKRIALMPITNNHKESELLAKKVADNFVGENIINPIFDYKEINEYIKDLDPNDRANIKMDLYKQSFEKVLKSKNKNASLVLNKYYAILNAKKQKYSEAYEKLKDEEFTLQEASEYIGLLAEKYSLDFINTKQGMSAVLLERYIKDYNDMIISDESEEFKEEYLSTLLVEFDEILAFSRKHEVKKQNKKQYKNEPTNTQTYDYSALEEAKAIIQSEAELINSIKLEELTAYLGQSINNTTSESQKYKIVSILLELSNNLNIIENALKVSNGNPSKELNQKINEIRNYISTYYDLKKQIPSIEQHQPQNADFQPKIIFLTDNSGKCIVESEIALTEKIYAKDITKLIIKLAEGNFKEAKSMEIEAINHKAFRIQTRSSRLSYLVLPNDYVLILCSAIKSEDILGKTKKVINNNKTTINDMYKTALTKEGASLLLDEQTQIRKNLHLTDNSFIDEKVNK